MKKTLAVLLVLTILLSGCTESPVQTEEITEETVEISRTEEPVELNAVEGLVMAYLPTEGFNPYSCMATVQRAVFSLIYESLFVVSGKFRAEPLLCEKFTVSEDGTVYQFTLLPDIFFSDGTRMTSEDVAASLKEAESSSIYSGRLRHVTRIEAVSPQELRITLDTPYENFALMLDIPIVRANTVSERVPVGSGPYYLNGSRLTLNRHWTQTQTQVVTYEEIELQAAKNTNEIRDKFEFGGTNLVYCDPNSASASNYRCDYEAWEVPTTVLHFLGFNTTSGIFRAVELRETVTCAIDRETLTNTVYGGFAVPTLLPCSPYSDLYDTSLAERYAYEPSRFRTVVHQVGAVDVEAKLLVCNEDQTRVEAAEKIAEMLNVYGIKISVTAVDYKTYLEMLRTGSFDLYYGEIRLTPNFDLSAFFSSDGAASYGGLASSSREALCMAALRNSGSYPELCAEILENGLLCPVVFKSYEVCAIRGVMPSLTPSVDWVFHNSATARSLKDAYVSESTTPTEVPSEEPSAE